MLSRRTLLLTATGTVGAVLFALVWLIEGATRAAYNPWGEPISALSLGPGGWVQRANFVVFGLLVMGSAVGWRRILAGGVSGAVYPLLRAIEGVALVVDGVFSQDPDRGYPPGSALTSRSMQGAIHSTFAFLAVTAIAIAWFVLARRLSVEPGWRGWARYSLLTGCLVILFIAIFGATGAQGGLAGLFERLATISGIPLGLAIVGRLALERRAA